MTTYNYQFSDFPAAAVDETRLKLEVAAAVPAVALVRISTYVPEDPDGASTCAVVFEADLDATQKATLDAVVAAHTGAPVPIPTFRASSTLVELQKQIVAVGGFEVLAGVVTTPEFFSKSLTALVSRIVGAYKAEGSGAELRVTENGGTILGTFQLTPAADWTKMQWFTSTPPSAGTNEYTLEGRLNGATSAWVRFVSMSLLEMCV